MLHGGGAEDQFVGQAARLFQNTGGADGSSPTARDALARFGQHDLNTWAEAPADR